MVDPPTHHLRWGGEGVREGESRPPKVPNSPHPSHIHRAVRCEQHAIAAARRLRTCAGKLHRGMAAGQRRLRVCSRCAPPAACLRIGQPERRGARAASAACVTRPRSCNHLCAAAAVPHRQALGRALARDGSGPAWQTPACARCAAQRAVQAAHAACGRRPTCCGSRACRLPPSGGGGYERRRGRRRRRRRWRWAVGVAVAATAEPAMTMAGSARRQADEEGGGGGGERW